MRIAATIVTNDTTGKLVEAVKSVSGWIDGIVLLSTLGEDKHPTNYAAEMEVFDGYFHVIQHPRITGETLYQTRNEALQAASDLGYDWGMVLDYDERMILRHTREELEQWLAKSYEVLLVQALGGGYAKDRLFRLPVTSGSFGGTRAHEAFSPNSFESERKRVNLPGSVMLFDETPKTEEALRSRNKWVILGLEQDIADGYHLGRAWYYLADTYMAEFQMTMEPEWGEKAVNAYTEAMKHTQWSEEAARAAFQICMVHLAMIQVVLKPEDPEYQRKKVAHCQAILRQGTLALAADTRYAELAYIVSVVYAQYVGNLEEGIRWAHVAAALGEYDPIALPSKRIGFRFPVGLYEGPYEVLFKAYEAIGNMSDPANQALIDAAKKRATRYRKEYQKALKKREEMYG